VAARRQASQRLCELGVKIDAAHGRVHVALLCDGTKMGELNAYDVDEAALKRPCRRALERLRTRVGIELVPYVVFRSAVPAKLRGVGIGSAMYLAAAEGVSRLNGALVQHACFADPEDRNAHGTTSVPAARVWKGARFRGPAMMSGGTVAYLPPTVWGRAERALTFAQMRIGMPASPRHPNPTSSAPDPRQLGPALRETLFTPAALDILSRHAALRNTTWTSGSCAILAMALHDWYPGFSYAVVVQGNLVHHVLVRYGNLYFDADGVSTKPQLQARWRRYPDMSRARVVPIEDDVQACSTHSNEHIVIVPNAIRDLSRYLSKSLGQPSSWGFPFIRANSTLVLPLGHTGNATLDHAFPLDELLIAEGWASN